MPGATRFAGSTTKDATAPQAATSAPALDRSRLESSWICCVGAIDPIQRVHHRRGHVVRRAIKDDAPLAQADQPLEVTPGKVHRVNARDQRLVGLSAQTLEKVHELARSFRI